MRLKALLAAAALGAGLVVTAGGASAYCIDASPVDPCFNPCDRVASAYRTVDGATGDRLPGGPYACPR